MRQAGTVGALLGLLWLVGCAAPAPSTGAAAPTVSSDPVRVTASPSPSPAAQPGPSPPAAGGLSGANVPAEASAVVARAVADAAERSGVPAGDVRIVRVEPRQWPDSGLGCPRAGMGYAQVITPGYLVVLEADGRSLEYHTDRARAELCAE
jgi:hypothetical protein